MVIRLAPRILAGILAISLVGCDSDKKAPVIKSDPELRLLSTFPEENQIGVSLGSKLKMRFDNNPAGVEVTITPVDASSGPVLLTLQTEDADPDEALTVADAESDAEPEAKVDLIYTMTGLKAGAKYTVSVGSNASELASAHYTFRTASPQTDAQEAPEVIFASVKDSMFSPTSASSFHFIFSEWLDPASLTEGSVQLTSEGSAIDVDVLLKKSRLLVSPHEALPSTGPYSLKISGLQDLQGAAVADITYDFSVEMMGDLSRLSAESRVSKTRYSAAATESALIGSDEILFSSELGVYLGDPERFDGYNPIIIRKGTQFEGSALKIKLNGVIPTTLDSETLRFTVMRDAVGYLWKNRYADDFEAPQSVQLTMDLAVSADNRKANGVVTQHLLGVQASGIATVTGSEFVFDLNTATHLDVLETAGIDANIALHLTTTRVNTQDFTDASPPVLAATLPSNGTISVGRDSPIRLFFNESLHSPSVQNNILLLRAGTEVNTRIEFNGAEVVVYPLEKLDPLTQYTVTASIGIEDLAGNATATAFSTSFTTAPNAALYESAPRLNSATPGVACALVDADLNQNIAGRCRNLAAGDADNSQRYTVFSLSANHRIELFFSTPVKAESLNIATACNAAAAIRVERVDWSSGEANCLEAVPGQATFEGLRWAFTPNKALQAGAQYRLVISGGADGNCNANEVCGENDKPLDTTPLDGVWNVGGGPDIVLPFVAETPQKGSTQQALVAPKITDINGNHTLDADETTYIGASLVLKMDLCDQNNCTNPTDLFGFTEDICAYPGDPSPRRPEYTCNADAPRTRLTVPPVRFDSPNVLYSTAVLPISLEETMTDPQTGETYIPIRLPAALIPLTNFNLAINALFDIDVDTGPLYLRLRQPGAEGSAPDIRGRIYTDESGLVPDARFTVDLDAYIDAPSLEIPLGGAHNLINTELSTTMEAAFEFTDEGQARLVLENQTLIKLAIEVTETPIGIANGDLVFEIQKGDFKIEVIANK